MSDPVRIENAQEAPDKEAQIQEQNTGQIERALDWSEAQAEDGKTCPFCGWLPAYDSKHKDASLRNHLRNRHLFQMIEAFLRGSVDPPTSDPDPVQGSGLEVVDSYEWANPLHINPTLKRRVTADGSRLIWINAQDVQRRRDEGWELVKAEGEELVNLDNSTEDGHVRTNEMILMRLAPRVIAKRDARKAREREAALMTRKEQFEQRIEGHARAVYDNAVRNGATKTQAQNLARATQQGLALGTVQIRRGHDG
jgi:hypothetical protein